MEICNAKATFVRAHYDCLKNDSDGHRDAPLDLNDFWKDDLYVDHYLITGEVHKNK